MEIGEDLEPDLTRVKPVLSGRSNRRPKIGIFA